MGNIAQTLSFDAWGQRRSASDWQTVIANEHKELIKNLSAFSVINRITNRGYTGHEMVDAVGIIHMNGRIYDAKLARFLQADPFIQAPYNTQSLNRYSYVWNNPLNATDPSGYWFLPLLKAAITAFVISDIIVTIGINSGWNQDLITALTVIANCIASACIGSGEAAKTLALKEVATIAIMGGITSMLQGGKFGHGFVSAGLSTVAGQGMRDLSAAMQFMSRVVIGGTLSDATGGKFANGAASAAFAWVVQSVGAGLEDSSPQSASGSGKIERYGDDEPEYTYEERKKLGETLAAEVDTLRSLKDGVVANDKTAVEIAKKYGMTVAGMDELIKADKGFNWDFRKLRVSDTIKSNALAYEVRGAIYVSKTVYENSNFALLHELAHVAGWGHRDVRITWDRSELVYEMSKSGFNVKNPYLYQFGAQEFSGL